jgi:hypothetical protein
VKNNILISKKKYKLNENYTERIRRTKELSGLEWTANYYTVEAFS